ncbi:Imm7 family immunity protein [Kribbella sp. NPDC056345]|uniref:Imm7 family immunity protein n=1 Tax=Kribbella sp. NPDC056345 TaxID=3345789 RepID=UPI0035DBE245
MFEYHGWATVRAAGEVDGGPADDLSRDAYDAVLAELAVLRNDWQTADLRISNGSAHVWLAGLRNHRQRAVIEGFGRIARLAPGSYGVLYVYDDEAAGEESNRWVAWVMKRGSVSSEADSFLSPHVGVVEDEEF